MTAFCLSDGSSTAAIASKLQYHHSLCVTKVIFFHSSTPKLIFPPILSSLDCTSRDYCRRST
uniref:Uncharacterized protein n=1 Tax=Oryza punctata TaxID=4537 RepID=A0A0E0LX19_ORYPU